MTYWMIQVANLIHQMVVTQNSLLLVAVYETVEIGKIAIQVHAIVIGPSNQIVIASLESIKINRVTNTICYYSLLNNKKLTYGGRGCFPTIRIHAGHYVDASRVDQGDNGLIAGQVLLAQIIGKLQEQLSAQYLIAVHVGNVLELGLHY